MYFALRLRDTMTEEQQQQKQRRLFSLELSKLVLKNFTLKVEAHYDVDKLFFG